MKYRLVEITATDRWGVTRTSIELQCRKWYGKWVTVAGAPTKIGGPFPAFHLLDAEGIEAIKTAISQTPEKYKGFTIIKRPRFNIWNSKFREWEYVALHNKCKVVTMYELNNIIHTLDTIKPEVKTVRVL